MARRLTAREPLPKEVHTRALKTPFRTGSLVVDVSRLTAIAKAHAAG